MDNDALREEYAELLLQLNEEIEGGFVREDEELFVIRQAYETQVGDRKIRPVIDFFFKDPELESSMTKMTVDEAKKLCFDILKQIEGQDDAEDLKEALNLHISCLKDYTAGNGKRNDRNCYIVRVKGSAFPMMIYFEEDDVSGDIDMITAGQLAEELKLLS